MDFTTKPHNKHITLKVVFLSAFLALGANIFQHYPMLSSMREIWYVFSFIYCVLFTLFAQLMGRTARFSGFEIYVLLLILTMPLLSAFMANSAFGQPLIYGILTHRSMATLGVGLAIIFWVRRGVFVLNDIRQALVLAGWSSFFIYISMSLLMNPENYGQVRGFVAGGTVEPYHFIFNSKFIIFLVIYNMADGLMRKSIKPLIYTLPLLFFLIFIDGGRSQFLSLLIVLSLLFVKYFSLPRLITLSVPFLVVVFVASMLVYSYQPQEVERQIEKFYAALSVVLTGKESSDASANARIREIGLAMPYIEKRPIFGNGKLSAQWKGGFFRNLGRFAPSDIGIFGGLFIFGFFGLMVFYFQFVFAWLKARRQKRFIKRGLMSDSPFRNALFYFILFLFIHSLATGGVIFNGAVSIVFIAILYTFNTERKTLVSQR